MIGRNCRRICVNPFYPKARRIVRFSSLPLKQHVSCLHSLSKGKPECGINKKHSLSPKFPYSIPTKSICRGEDSSPSASLSTQSLKLWIRRNMSSTSQTDNNTANPGPIEESIRSKVEQSLSPVYSQIINESYMHNVPKNSETHFKLVVVSNQFESQSLVQRHRTIHSLLKEELEGGVHALSMVLKTPEQWSKIKNDPEQLQKFKSPPCAGGSGK